MSEPQGRNAWTPEKFKSVLKKAGRIVSCSFGVAGLRDKKTGKMQVSIMFSDDTDDNFAFVFQFEKPEEAVYLCHDVLTLQDRIDKGELEPSDGI